MAQSGAGDGGRGVGAGRGWVMIMRDNPRVGWVGGWVGYGGNALSRRGVM